MTQFHFPTNLAVLQRNFFSAFLLLVLACSIGYAQGNSNQDKNKNKEGSSNTDDISTNSVPPDGGDGGGGSTCTAIALIKKSQNCTSAVLQAYPPSGCTYSYRLFRDGMQVATGSGGLVDFTVYASGKYYLVASNSIGTFTSSTLTLSIVLTAGTISGAKTICYNALPGTISATSPTGGTGSYTYQWQRSFDGTNWSDITGATSAYHSPTVGLTRDTYYRRKVTSGTCGSTYTSSVKITVYGELTAGTISTSKTICYNTHAGTINVTAPTGGTGSYTYQWEQSGDGSSWSTIPYATSSTYSPGYLTSTSHYRRKVTSGGCGTKVTLSMTITVVPYPSQPTLQSAGARIGDGPVTITVSGAPSGGSYKLYRSTGSLLQTSANGSFEVTVYQTTDLLSTTYFYATALNAALCESTTKLQIPVNVYKAPLISSDGNSIYKDHPLELTASSGFDTYVWSRDGVSIPGATSNVYSATEEGSYTVTVTKSGAGSFTTPAYAVVKGSASEQQNINYIITNTPLQNGIKDPTELQNLAIELSSQSIQYFDGLGRPLQTVATQASPQKKDLVQPFAYDAHGRNAVNFLPYVSPGHSGFYKANATKTNDPAGQPTTYQQSEQYSFYDPASPDKKVARDASPFAVTLFEPSPLNRAVEQGAPGVDWQTGTGNTIKSSVRSNTYSGDRVYDWRYVSSATASTFGAITSNAYYVNDQLLVTITEDERGNEVREFKDKLGLVVLKEIEGVDEAGVATWLRTYYVYDHFGNLRVVLPPLFSRKYLTHNTTPATYSFNTSHTGFKELCFYYHYDGRKRMVEKHVPGAGVVSMVYDHWDRLVLTQDAEQASVGQWLYTKYDQLNRPILTGLWQDGRSRKDVQQVLSDASKAGTVARFEVRDQAQAHGYTLSSSFPTQAAAVDVLSVTYYDDYNFKFKAEDTVEKYKFTAAALSQSTTQGTYTFPTAENLRVSGQLTGSKVRILGSSEYLQTVTYYDEKYRPIQIIGDNQLGGIERTSTLYNFPGWVLRTCHEHALEGKEPLITWTDHTYDHSGRLLDTYQQIGSLQQEEQGLSAQQTSMQSTTTQEATTTGGGAVTWTNETGVLIEGSKITKTAADGFGNAGASSAETMAAGADGWIEWTITAGSNDYQLGLSAQNLNHNANTADYQVFLHTDGKFRIYESGTFRLTSGFLYQPGDVIRIARNAAGVVSYLRNGESFYQSPTTSTAALMVDVTFRATGAYVDEVRASFVAGSGTDPEPEPEPVPATPGTVSWTNETGVLIEGSKITKTAAAGFGNAGASSAETMAAGADGWIEWTITAGSNDYQLGLSAQNLNHNANTADYQVFLHTDGKFRIYESGTFRLTSGFLYQPGDVIRIARNAGVVSYLRNGESFYQSPTTSTAALMVDVTFRATGAYVDEVRASFVAGTDPDRPIVSPRILISRNHYNELGELISKQLHSEDNTKFLQTLDYRYNIRGWLSRMNNAALTEATPTDTRWKDLFGFELLYNEVDATLGNQAQFNGNISAMRWSSDWGLNPGEQQRAYKYTYDQLNRISKGDYLSLSSGTSPANSRFSTTYGYDVNGNILNLTRKGATEEGQWGDMDVLSYKYYDNQASNRLRNVSDGEDKTRGFKDGSTDPNIDEYLYDANGNMIADKNKGIEEILYNHLNLPELIRFSNGDMISYTYDAAGIKLSQEVTKGQEPVKRTSYVGGMVYVDGQLQFMQHPEGRIVFTQAAAGDSIEAEYQYHLKDHLGNVRLSFSSKPGVTSCLATMEAERAQEEESHFLEFGNTRVPVNLQLDHTHTTPYPTGSSAEVVRLNGYRDVRQGPRKTLRVLPGDTIRAQVWAKYLDLREDGGLNVDAILAALAGASGYTVTTELGGATKIVFDETGATALLNPLDEQSQPKGFLSWQFVADSGVETDNDGGHVSVSAAAAISNTSGLGNHELLQIEYIVRQPGRINIELDVFAGSTTDAPETRDIDIYFDDFEVFHHHSPILQSDDYYPFGLTFNSYQREGGLENKYLNQGKELQDDLDLDVYDFHARMYDPALARTLRPDPLADMYESYSPYSWVLNNPLLIVDPTGMASDTTKANTKDDLDDIKVIEISLAPCECNLSVEDIVKAIQNAISGTSEAEKKQRFQELEGKRSRGEKLTPSEKQELQELEDHIFGWNEQGLLRRNMFGDNWPSESLSKAIRKFAGDEPEVHITETGKVLYRNPTSGVQVVYDVQGDYFRIEDTTKPGKRVFMDMHGTIPNNTPENRGRSQKEYNQITHFTNTDRKK